MAQTCQIKPSKTHSSWSATFPTSVQSSTDSCTYMKKLLAVSVSNILYLRGIFPESSFCDCEIDSYNIKFLNETTKSLGTNEVIGWIKGCCEALDKKFLRQAIIGIYLDKNDPTKILESYTFKFNYHLNETTLSVNGGTETKIPDKMSKEMIMKHTIDLLKLIENLTINLEPIPPVSYITMKLLYFDEITPESYEPPGFKSCNFSPFQFEGNEEPNKLNIGKVSTKHHTVTIIAQTTSQTSDPDIMNNSSQQVKHSKPLSLHSQHDNSGKENLPVGTVLLDGVEKEKDEDDIDQIFCVCGDVNNDGLMVGCEICKKWQHSECFGVLNNDEVPTLHMCDLCHGINGQECTDPTMMTLTVSKRKDLALYRRMLRHCGTLDILKITVNEIVRKLDVERYVAQNIMNLMEKENYLCKTKRKAIKKILKNNIEENGYMKYFNHDYDITTTPLYLAPLFVDKKPLNKRRLGAGDSREIENIVSQTESISLLDVKNNANEQVTGSKRKNIASQSLEHEVSDENEENDNSNKRPKCSHSDKNISV